MTERFPGGRRLAAIAICGLIAIGCSDDTTTVDVFAASSLTDAFSELEARFETENPGVDIRLNLAGSDTLRRQLDDGAEADVFAPASIDLFEGLDAEPETYATNQLTIIVSRSVDPGRDLTAPGAIDGLILARCADGVPCGDAADTLIDSLGLDVSGATVTSEANVRAVLSKVELGEADVGLVYRTDALAGSSEIRATDLAAPEASVTLAVAAISTDPEARRFVDFVHSETAGEVFAGLGFGPAP